MTDFIEGENRKQTIEIAPGKISLVSFLLLLTKFVWNKFEQALPGLKGGLQGCNPYGKLTRRKRRNSSCRQHRWGRSEFHS